MHLLADLSQDRRDRDRPGALLELDAVLDRRRAARPAVVRGERLGGRLEDGRLSVTDDASAAAASSSSEI